MAQTPLLLLPRAPALRLRPRAPRSPTSGRIKMHENENVLGQVRWPSQRHGRVRMALFCDGDSPHHHLDEPLGPPRLRRRHQEEATGPQGDDSAAIGAEGTAVLPSFSVNLKCSKQIKSFQNQGAPRFSHRALGHRRQEAPGGQRPLPPHARLPRTSVGRGGVLTAPTGAGRRLNPVSVKKSELGLAWSCHSPRLASRTVNAPPRALDGEK